MSDNVVAIFLIVMRNLKITRAFNKKKVKLGLYFNKYAD